MSVSEISRIGQKKGVIWKVKTSIYPIWSRNFCHFRLVEGNLRDTLESFRCLFVENNTLSKYIIPRMYGQSPPLELKTSRVWVPLLKTILKRYSNDIDMCIAVLPVGYDPETKGFVTFKSDILIRSFLDTSVGPNRIKKQLKDNKRRFFNKMDKNPAFSCRVSNDVKDFNLFYTQMHIPHVQKRFQDLADIDSYHSMKTYFQRGFLLVIEEADKAIAGVLCNIENDTLFFRRTGVLDGNDEYIKRGASSAQYYFTLKYALEHGIPKVDFMRSRPFFDDGVYLTKREWGAEVYLDNEATTSVFFFIPRISDAVVKFFENNPLIIHREKKLYGLIGWNGDDLSAEDEKTIYKKYYTPGLKGFVVIQPSPVHSAKIIDYPEDATHINPPSGPRPAQNGRSIQAEG